MEVFGLIFGEGQGGISPFGFFSSAVFADLALAAIFAGFLVRSIVELLKIVRQ